MIELSRTVLNKKISVQIILLDEGVQVIISGGDLSHIGAFSWKAPNEKLDTLIRPSHKEALISEKWAAELSAALNEPVAVTAGIHYDGIGREEIMEIVEVSTQLLDEALALIQKERRKKSDGIKG